MIKHVFAYFNELGGFFGKPIFSEFKDDFVKEITQSLYGANQETLESLSDDSLYYLGTFDNETGLLESKKEFVASLSPICKEVLLKKFGVKKDARDKN